MKYLVCSIAFISWGCIARSVSPPIPVSVQVMSRQLEKATYPDWGVRYVIAPYGNAPRLIRFSKAYAYVSQHWVYRKDSTEQMAKADSLLQQKEWIGDCEDLAAVWVAIARLLDFDAYMVIGIKKNSSEGHAWAEVLVSRNALSESHRSKLKSIFGDQVSWVKRGASIYMQLSPEGSLSPYTALYRMEAVPMGRTEVLKN